MSDSALVKFYHSYLDDQDSAGFIKAIATRYELATLMAIARRGDVPHRRAAVLAIGYLGNYSANAAMGRALADEDRGVRMLAENGIHDIWMSAGTVTQRQQLEMAERLIVSDQIQSALDIIHRVRKQNPKFAEVSRLMGVAHFASGRIRESRTDFRQAVVDNPYQYQAAIGLANCSARVGDSVSALRWFKRALRINPELEMIRLHVAQLTQSPDQL